MSAAEKQLLINAIHQQLNEAVSSNLYPGLAYGFFLAVCCISVRILLSKGPLSHSPGSMFLFGITTTILILSTTVIVLSSELTSQGISTIIKTVDPSFDRVWSPHKTYVVGIMLSVITRLPFLSDAVCAWRAMVLWKYDRRVVTVLSICLLGTFAASIYDIYDINLAVQAVSVLTQREEMRLEGVISMIVVGPILATNVLSTSFIAWKAWDYHATVGAHFRKGRPSGRVEKVLMLLIESGFVYCIFWTLSLLGAFCILPSSTKYVLNLTIFFISGTYPVSVNVLAVTTQSYESSGVLPVVQSVK